MAKGKTGEVAISALSLDESSDIKLNQIDLIPQKIEVKDSHIWKKKDMSKVKDFKQIEIISDWTYSTPYKGNVRYLSKYADHILKETSLQLEQDSDSKIELSVESTEEGIPYDRLGRDNPILHFGEVYMFEDDLGD